MDEFTKSATTVEELLAIIHRDGGHYLDEHGLEKAIAQAECIILNERANAELNDAKIQHNKKALDKIVDKLQDAEHLAQQAYDEC